MTLESCTDYNLSFTALSLRPELSRIVAEVYLDTGEWHAAKASVLAENLLQARSYKSAIRVEAELRQRLSMLTKEQLELIATGTTEEATLMAWLATCKRSPFIFKFAAQVLREKVASGDPVLRPSDYEDYVNSEALSHPQLASLSESSQYKIRQVLFRMLKEVGILSSGEAIGTLHRLVLFPKIRELIRKDNPRLLSVFLVPDAEIPNL